MNVMNMIVLPKTFKHNIAAILALTALFSPFSLKAEAIRICFDDSSESWTVVQGKAVTVETEAYQGHCLQLEPQTLVTFRLPLKQGTRYRLSAWLKTASGNTTVCLQGTDLREGNFTLSSALSEWAHVQQEFHYPIGLLKNPRIEVVFNGNSKAWVDEIVIEELGKYLPPVCYGIPPQDRREVRTDFGVSMQSDDKIRWMHDAKLGMFIHWGLYSGVGKGEWYMCDQGVSIEDYSRLAYPEAGERYFDAVDYHPAEWVDLAKAVGAGYMVLTAMHHDGFALFETQVDSAFSSQQRLGRDLVREYVDACREGGLRVGLYKTLINWRYPGYYDVSGTDCKKNNFGYTTAVWHKENARQMKEDLYVQTRELMTRYGKIDLLFWDGGWIEQRPSDREGARLWEPSQYLDQENPWPISPEVVEIEDSTGKALGLMGMVRHFQPDILVNPRSGWTGDYTCEEGDSEVRGGIRGNLTEKCMALHKVWGYTPDCENPDVLMSVDKLKRIFADCLMRNMNLNVNLAPDRHGRIPVLMEERLREFGQWVQRISPAVYGTTGGPWQPVDEQYGFCYRDSTLYLFLHENFHPRRLSLPPLDEDMDAMKAYELSHHSEIRLRQRSQTVMLKGLRRVHPLLGHKNSDGEAIHVIAIELNRPVRNSQK